MVNIDTLPKIITVYDKSYQLDLHITFPWDKICVSYKLRFPSPTDNKTRFALSNVVEPDMTGEVEYTDDPFGIMDVHTTEEAFEVLSARITNGVADGRIKIENEK